MTNGKAKWQIWQCILWSIFGARLSWLLEMSSLSQTIQSHTPTNITCQKQPDNVNSRSISSFVRWPIIFILWTFLTEYFFLLLRLVRYNIEIFMILFYVSGRSITRQTKESKLRPTLPFLFQLNNKYQLDLQSAGSSLYLTLHRLCPHDAIMISYEAWTLNSSNSGVVVTDL